MVVSLIDEGSLLYDLPRQYALMGFAMVLLVGYNFYRNASKVSPANFCNVGHLVTRLQLDAIPTVGGPGGTVSSYLGALRYVKHARSIAQEGYSHVS